MAERVVRVCDICGEPATQSVTFKMGGRSLAQDLCETHARELVARSHTPKRGRKPGSSSAGAAAAPRGRGRPRKSAAAAPAKRTRRKITDPAVLEKRRAALAKARQVRAQKRAAAAGAAG